MSSAITVAAAAYPVDFLGGWQAYVDKLTHWVAEACDNGADLLLFPEYASMELVSTLPDYRDIDLAQQLHRLQPLLADYLELHRALAQRFGVHIVAGSFAVEVGAEFRNRAYVFSPDGTMDFQEKLQMTRFENEQWCVSAGNELKVFDTAIGRLAINICYDSEFPLIARAQVEAGAGIILAPSCTDTLAGFHRVQIGCRARALENQCFVVQASLVGHAEWSEAVDINIGRAGFYCPVDRGYPDNGILLETELNKPGWGYQTLDVAALQHVRDSGQVFNHRDWDTQQMFTLMTTSLQG